MTALGLPIARAVRRPFDVVLSALARPDVMLGGAATAVAVAGSWIPSYWGDEGASVMSAERSLPSLWNELSVVDAVHGVYYVFLHVWIHYFGASEFSTRFPSAVAVGFAVAGTVVLARRWWGRRVAWASGALALAVPALTNLGMEARSYAFSMAITVWLTVYVLRLRRRGSRRAWVAYAAAIAASSYLFLYLLLLIPLHAGVLLLSGTRGRVWLRWAAASVCATLAALPIALAAYGQRRQIEFLTRRDYVDLQNVFVRQWFQQPFAAATAWVLILGAVVWVLAQSPLRRRALMRRLGMTIVMAGGVTVMLVIGNTVTPLYNLRYTSSAVPAVAVLMGVGAVGIGRMIALRLTRGRMSRGGGSQGRMSRGRMSQGGGARLIAVVAVVAFAVAALPSYVSQRSPFGKGGSDLRQVSQLMGRLSHRGDAVVFDQSPRTHLRPRLAVHLYPSGFRALTDVGLITPYQDVRGLWDRVVPASALPQVVAGHGTVWAIEARGDGSPDVRVLEADRYRPVAWYPIHRDEAVELESPVVPVVVLHGGRSPLAR